MSYNIETKMYEGYIYCITNKINGKQYIGQTTRDIHVRFLEHVRKSRYYKSYTNPLYNAICKYGENNFCIKEIDSIQSNNKNDLIVLLNHSEKYYINKLNTLCPYGYNIESGGNSCANKFKRKVKQYDFNLNFVKEFESISQASCETGVYSTNIINVCNYTELSAGGYIWRYYEDDLNLTIDNFKKRHNKSGRKIYQYDIYGNFIKEYKSISNAVRSTKLPRNSITRCCYEYHITNTNNCKYIWSFDNNLSKENVKLYTK